jgi:hypothetical protein
MDRLSLYSELAERYDHLGQVSMRDRFLILAADAALEVGQAGEAERIRLRLLQGSRHHMLRPYASFAEAARAVDVQTYLRDLRTNYPPEVAQQLLDSLKEPGAEGKPGAALYQTQSLTEPQSGSAPIDASPVRPIPPTAPLIDMTSRQWSAPIGGTAREGRPVADDSNTYPIRDDPGPPIPRPAAQPLPGRVPLARPIVGRVSPSAAQAQGQAVRPTSGIPVTQPVLPRVAPAAAPSARRMEAAYPLAPLASPQSPAQERETPPEGGAWFIMLLVGVVGTAGLALLVFTFARPFLP